MTAAHVKVKIYDTAEYCLICLLSSYYDYSLRQLEYASVHICYNMSDKTNPSKSNFTTLKNII